MSEENKMTSTKSKEPTYRYRLATEAVAPAILDVLLEVAPEIPVDTHDGRKEFLAAQIHRDCFYRGVWIALDHNNQIVGFLMAEPQKQEIKLPYGGVRKRHREHHIFRKLMDKAKAMAKIGSVPLTAVVNHANKSDMASRLLKLGFMKVGAGHWPNEDTFRWQPGPTDVQGGGLP